MWFHTVSDPVAFNTELFNFEGDVIEQFSEVMALKKTFQLGTTFARSE
jgi:hypothetical protein